jgi:hypothetical protein
LIAFFAGAADDELCWMTTAAANYLLSRLFMAGTAIASKRICRYFYINKL